MTIDPENFEPQGKPSLEQAKTIWNSLPSPSARKVAAMLEGRGYKVSYRTIARWHESGWGSKGESVREKNHELVTAEVNKAKGRIAAAAEAENPGLKAAIEGGALTDPDYARIEKMVTGLAEKDIGELRAIQEKKRAILNIVLMEEATRRAHVMTLIPKDTSALVGAFTDDAKAVAPSAPIQPTNGQPNGNGTIEGEFHVVAPVSKSIRQFLAKENA